MRLGGLAGKRKREGGYLMVERPRLAWQAGDVFLVDWPGIYSTLKIVS